MCPAGLWEKFTTAEKDRSPSWNWQFNLLSAAFSFDLFFKISLKRVKKFLIL